jgi:hypothetical protein
MGEPLEALMAENAQPAASQRLFAQMMRDIMAGGQAADPTEQVGPQGGCQADADQGQLVRGRWVRDQWPAADTSAAAIAYTKRIRQTQETLQVQACYAMGYNLAIEYMADYEKTWMLAAFRDLNKRVLAPHGRALTEWLFLEVAPLARSPLQARSALACSPGRAGRGRILRPRAPDVACMVTPQQ